MATVVTRTRLGATVVKWSGKGGGGRERGKEIVTYIVCQQQEVLSTDVFTLARISERDLMLNTKTVCISIVQKRTGMHTFAPLKVEAK
jgi:hypothetical protein